MISNLRFFDVKQEWRYFWRLESFHIFTTFPLFFSFSPLYSCHNPLMLTWRLSYSFWIFSKIFNEFSKQWLFILTFKQVIEYLCTISLNDKIPITSAIGIRRFRSKPTDPISTQFNPLGRKWRASSGRVERTAGGAQRAMGMRYGLYMDDMGLQDT